jgi:hypothetical protein
MSGRTLNAITLLGLLLARGSVEGQVICQFAPNYMLATPVPDQEHKVFLGANVSYGLDDVNQWAAGADVAYHPSPALALEAGAAYCDPKFDLDPKPMFGASATWSAAVSANRAWAVSGTLGVSYVAIDLGSTTQRDIAAPATVAIHYTRGRLRAYTGGMIQYGRSWTSVTTFRSKIDPGMVAGLEIRLSRTLAAGAGYNFLWFEDASGNSGILDRAGLRLRYAL